MAWMDFKHIPAKQVMIAKVIEVLEEVEPNLYPVPYEQWKEWTQGK